MLTLRTFQTWVGPMLCQPGSARQEGIQIPKLVSKRGQRGIEDLPPKIVAVGVDGEHKAEGVR